MTKTLAALLGAASILSAIPKNVIAFLKANAKAEREFKVYLAKRKGSPLNPAGTWKGE